MKRRSKKSTKNATNLDTSLVKYGAAAAAALAAGSAQAAIQYSGPTNILVSAGQDPSLVVDLDGAGGGHDLAFTINATYFGITPVVGALVDGNLVDPPVDPPAPALPDALSLFATAAAPGQFAVNFAKDASIGGSPYFLAASAFLTSSEATALQADFSAGGYLGFRFQDGVNSGNNGWVHITPLDGASDLSTGFTIDGWAYEDTTGAAIAAGAVPEPGTLSLLAAGVAGVATLRRRRKAKTQA